MRLLLWGAAIAGGYYLYNEHKKPKATVTGLVNPKDPTSERLALENYVSVGACCGPCAHGGPCAG
jgi:hypothetical protein